ncbi:SdpA family antimicrobial peptide system protein [Kitasatospora sp. NPDC057198]|uniref:SdpA family antimicrobial peptide system protein n=1 Tax=Kitasatospora sp. NPDC057198 TaxID=3346046 RepID=UPI00362F6694
MTESQATASPPSSAQGFQFTAFLLLVVLLASLIQVLPAWSTPGWMQAGRSAMAVLWPQGWGFFADEPSASTAKAFTVGDGAEPIAVTQLQLDHRTAWGLSRSAYARYVELGNLSALVAAHDWLDCAHLAPSACRNAALHAPLVQISNLTAHPTFCGHLLIVVANPARWTTDTRLWQSDWKILRAVNGDVKCAG